MRARRTTKEQMVHLPHLSPVLPSLPESSQQHGNEVRNRALQEALDDLDAYLATDQGQVVIFDATNSTEERRSRLVRGILGGAQVSGGI
jgi:hypothetical protein